MSVRAITAFASALLLLAACSQAKLEAPTSFAAQPQRPTSTPAENADPPATPTAVLAATAIATSISTIEVERHGVDLPTFLHAASEELARDPRIQIVTERIDGALRTDAAPVAVVEFELTAPNAVGRQYVLAHPDGTRFMVLTCLTPIDAVSACEDAVDRLELTD